MKSKAHSNRARNRSGESGIRERAAETRSGLSHRLLLPTLCVLLAVATLLCYWPAYSGEFVDFDDFDYVQGNPHVATGLSADSVRWAFTHVHASNWHPLTWISHMADVQLFGLDPHPHHVVGVAFHAANVVLLFLMLRALTGELLLSFVVAGLYALHPVNVESVAWIAQRKTTLTTLFAILTIWTYGNYARTGNRLQYGASLGCFVLCLLSKQWFVTMPFLLLLLDYWPLRRAPLEPPVGQLPNLRSMIAGWLRLVPDKLPYFALGIAASLVTIFAQEDAITSTEFLPIPTRLGNAILSYVAYMGLLFWPRRLAVFYPVPYDDITLLNVALAATLLVAISIAMYYLGRRWRYCLVGWFWYLGSLVPVIGIIHVGAQGMADRYAYVPFWGLMIIVVWGTRDLLQAYASKTPVRVATACVLSVVFVALATLCVRQAATWKDTLTLFSHAAENTQRNWMAHRQVATELYNLGRYQEARHHCEEAIRANENLSKILHIYGVVLFELGFKDEAVETLLEAQRASPDRPTGYAYLGWIYAELGRDDEALQQFQLAEQRLDDTSPPYSHWFVHSTHARSLSRVGRLPEARDKLRLALQADPKSLPTMLDLASAELPLGEVESASATVDQVLALEPDNVRALYLLAQVQATRCEGDNASRTLQRAWTVELRPGPTMQVATQLLQCSELGAAQQILVRLLSALQSAGADAKLVSDIQYKLGDLALQQANADEARRYYESALAAWPDHFAANNNLAWMLATSPHEQLRDPARAVQLALHACELTGRQDDASLGTLAAAYAAAGDFERAIETAQTARELAAKADNQSAVKALDEQLKLYRASQGFIEQ